jgi:pyrroloquinoline quinone (PQQ) biosynthesis protein C
MTDGDVKVDVNEDALETERERRTVELKIPVDDVHATAVDQLESAGVPLENVLAERLRPATEGAIHQILQEAKYSE